MEHNKAYFSDCLTLMQNLEPQSVDFIFADIPYNTTACDWDKDILPLNRHTMAQKGKKQVPIYLDQHLLNCYEQGVPREQAIEMFEAKAKDGLWDYFKRVLKPNGVVAMTASQPFTTRLAMSNMNWLKYEWIWEKNRGSNFFMVNESPIKEHENILIFFESTQVYNPIKEKRKGGGESRVKYKINPSTVSENYNIKAVGGTYDKYRYPSSIQKFNTQTGLHPTKKPTKLLLYLIKTYTNEGDLVLDPTAGSGTTGVAALELNRNFILMEKDKKYFDKIELRLQDTGERLGLIKDIAQVKDGQARQLGLF